MREERFSPWSESDEADNIPVRNRFDAIIDFLRGRHEEDNEDGDNDEGKKKSKSSRWRKFLHRMFSGEEGESTEEHTNLGESKRRPLIVFEPVPTASAEAQDYTEELDTGSGLETATSDQFDAPKGVTEPAEQDAAIATDSTQAWPLSQDTEGAFPPENKVAQAVRQESPLSDRSSSNVEYSSVPSSYSHKPEADNDKSQNLGVGATGLIALNYLSSRGRKKLEKRTREKQKLQDRNLEEVRKDLEIQKQELSAQKSRLEKLKSQLSSRPSVGKSKNGEAKARTYQQAVEELIFDRTKQSTQERGVSEVEGSNKTAGKYESANDLTEQEDKEKLQAAEREQKTQHSSESDINILQQQHEEIHKRVATESKKLEKELQARLDSNYVEREHERRHEVRDKSTSVGSEAASIGKVLSSMNLPTNKPSTTSGLSIAAKNRKQPFLQPVAKEANDNLRKDTLYKEAVKGGILSGLLVVAVLTAVMVLR